jgi:hypothetical protein
VAVAPVCIVENGRYCEVMQISVPVLGTEAPEGMVHPEAGVHEQLILFSNTPMMAISTACVVVNAPVVTELADELSPSASVSNGLEVLTKPNSPVLIPA